MTFTDQQDLKEELHEYVKNSDTSKTCHFSHWEVTDAESQCLPRLPSYLLVFSEIWRDFEGHLQRNHANATHYDCEHVL